MTAVAGLLVVGGVVWLADLLDLIHVGPRTAVAWGLVVLGAVLVVTGWRGRALVLVPLGLLAVAGLVAVEVLDVPLDAGTGDRTVIVDRPGELQDRYELAAGELEVDLSEAPLSRRGTTEVAAAVGLGSLRVVVPDDTAVRIHAHVKAGEITGSVVDGGSQDGAPVDEVITLDAEEGAPRLSLTLEVGLGEVRVVRG
ncbi:MAG TPA: LiaF domain-containing protein [Acidimicrobiales bacterium]